MNISDLKIDLKCLGDKKYLVDVSPYYAYKNGEKSSEIDGYKYTVVLPAIKFEKLSVKIAGDQQLEASGDNYVSVRFDELEVKVYVIDGKPLLSAKASAIKTI